MSATISPSLPLREQKFLNPETGRLVGYWVAKYKGLIPEELLAQEAASLRRNVPSAPLVSREDVKVETVRVEDLKFDERLFVPLKTKDPILDAFLSNDGGFMPASNVVLVGGPGVGKTTVGLAMVSKLSRLSGKRVLFVSGEMNRIDMYRYCRRFPEFSRLDTLFLGDYATAESNPQYALENVLEAGYDVVLIDSWAEVASTVRDHNGWGSKRAESWILDLMQRHNEGGNELGIFTTFAIIQQVTKSGEFLGSNRLKHMTSAMLELYRDRSLDTCVMEFSKNRLGVAGEQIAYTISNDSVRFHHLPEGGAGQEDADDEDGE